MKSKTIHFSASPATLTRVCGVVAIGLILALPGLATAADGDVFFLAESKSIDVGAGLTDVETTFDIFVNVEGGADIPATAWATLLVIEPMPGATGSIIFNLAPIINDEPNIEPATFNPFLDFDRDFDGKAYGETTTDVNLTALSLYIEPTTTAAPPTDAFGNLTLPDGAGLAAIPVLVEPGTSGQFMVTFNSDPDFTGVTFRTGLGDEDIGIYPSGTHVSGILSVVPEPSTLLLACLASMTLCGIRRRRRK